MQCNNPNCGNKERIKPIEGQGSFQGYDVFQCPSCRQVANTIKRDPIRDRPLAGIKKAKNIKKGKDPFVNKSLPERIRSFVGKQPPAPRIPTASDYDRWNTTKFCGNKKCGYSENVVNNSPKEINLVHCPKCKTKMQSKPFSPNF